MVKFREHYVERIWPAGAKNQKGVTPIFYYALQTTNQIHMALTENEALLGWPDGLEQNEFYEMPSDDCPDIRLRLFVDSQGDVYVSIVGMDEDGEGVNARVRLCTMQGAGSRHLRTRVAALYLANAIRLDSLKS